MLDLAVLAHHEDRARGEAGERALLGDVPIAVEVDD
jgi:hypothetical protein